MAVGQAMMRLEVLASSRAGSLPQGICDGHSLHIQPGTTVGASLLAIVVGQATMMSRLMTSSRAGSLPRGLEVNTGFAFTEDLWELACLRWRWVRQ